jgi:flagellar hook-basal body complex protein FliE
MSLPGISSALPVYGLQPSAGIADAPGVRGPLQPLSSPAETGAAQPSGESFASMLGHMVEEVNTRQTVASQAMSALQSGQNVSLHQAVISMEEANVSFQLMVEVRNKLLDSYQEIMRMNI